MLGMISARSVSSPSIWASSSSTSAFAAPAGTTGSAIP
jgi:hypothetical protein